MAKTVLITGATQGIGAVLAREFAREGYQVAINCYSEETMEQGGKQVRAECAGYGVEAECFVADVSNFEACGKMIAAVKERFGAVDVLINNAGITKDGSLPRMSEEAFDTVIAVNLKSVFNMTRQVSQVMMRQRHGHIINMSSVAGVYGNRGQINYSASKAGIIGITKTTAKELGSRNILCNAIAPGIIESPMTDVLPEEVKKKMLDAVSLGRFGTAQDVADAALFLAKTNYMSGQVLVVDGCMSV